MVTRNQTCGLELAEAGLPNAAATAAARSKYFREKKLKSLVPGEVVNIGIILNCTGRAVDADLPAYTDERLNEFVRGLNYCYNALNDDIISRTPVSQRSVANTTTIGVNFYIEAIRRRFVLGTNEVHSAFLADDMSLPYEERSWDGYSLTAMQGTEVTDGPAQRDCGGIDPYRSDLFLNMWVARYVEYATSPTSFVGSYDHYLAGEIGTSGWAWKPRDSFQWYQAVWMQDFNVGSRFSPYDVSDSPPNFASTGPRGYGTGTVIAHELGHYLNLDHTWGGPDTTYPPSGPNTSCSVARGCYDLPTNDGSFDNNLLTNPPVQASGQDITIPRDEATECTVDGVVQNVPYSNYMNYADPSWFVCFTNSQVEVMRDCIQNPTQFSTHRLIGTKAPPVNCNMGRGGNNIQEMSAAGSVKAYVGNNVVWEKSLVPPAPGPTPIPPPDTDDIQVTVSGSYWVRGDGTSCGDNADWTSCFNGTHNITDPGREISYEESAGGGSSGNWNGRGFQPDTFTQPNTIFVITGNTGTCVDGDEYPSVSAPFVRVQFKLSDGTITDWAYSP